jgi:exodeoxyribonuclease VII small subunit
MTPESETYKDNYAILKEVAETLRTQKEPDIDALIPMVDRALAAYKICKDRLQAVKTAFGERLPENLPE